MNEASPHAAAAPPTATAAHAGPHGADSKSSFWALTLGSIGVVYGDIGTSPLYALREAVQAAAGKGPPTPGIVLGVLSLILWSLIIVVTIKYVLVLLRADNNGEGGTLSLTALAFRALGRREPIVLLIGVIGASMFYGSALITPALSVLSAVEGLEVAAPGLEHYVLPISIGILVVLFAVQSRGTARVSTMFGPVMMVWLVVIALAGCMHLADNLHVFAAVNPYYAIAFLVEHKTVGLVTTGFVMLAVTGGEALYTDLGHFGRKPIQTAWLGFVLPALLLSYFGQGALILNDPTAVANPFYRLVPGWLMFPMVVLATAATVIASQAVITGAFSMTRQAIQLGLLPRVEIRHTSAEHSGQIYIPRVNIVLLIGVLLLVLVFKTSSALASAYGLAVATTMAVDGVLAGIVIWKLWRWRWWTTLMLMVPFILLDSTFLLANLLNFFRGAWAPVLFGATMVLIVVTWRRGMRILGEKTRRLEMPLAALVSNLQRKPPHLVPGTAVFLTSDPEYAPTALLHSLKHYKVLHEHNVILTIRTAETPRVSDDERVEMVQTSPLFARVVLRFGFMETPNVPKALVIARKQGWHFDIMATSFFVSRRSLKPAAHSFMPRWQDRLFIAISKSTSDATDFFHIPTGRVVEVGTQVTI